VTAGDVARLTRRESAGASELRLCAAGTGLRARLYAGRPLREPVAARGAPQRQSPHDPAASFAPEAGEIF
jgi:hypothetical protein